MKAKAIFVAGSDTGVGKTLVTGFLARYLKAKGYKTVTQKWVQTGCVSSGFSQDAEMHLKIMGCDRNQIKKYMALISPYVFKTPCSPHLASQIEGKKIGAGKIKRSFELLSKEFDFVIVEGAGGALVPFNKKQYLIDIANENDLYVLVVAQNKLGAINHTLLTLEALKNRKMKILGVIFNNARNENKIILKDNPRIVRSLSGEDILGILPWVEEYDKLYNKFIPIGQRILNTINKV